jgi:magnesium transporter
MSKKKHHHRKSHKRGLPPGTLVYTGHRPATAAQARTIQYNEATYADRPHYAPELRNPNAIFWLDIHGLSDTTFVERIGTDFQIHPLALEDVLNTQQRAKLEEYDNGLFVVLHHLRLDCDTLELSSEQIALFAGPDFVLSFQEDPDDTFAPVRRRAEEGLGRTRKKGTDYLTYALADTLVDSYFAVLDDLESQILALEEQLHTQGAEPSSKARMFALKRTASDFRHRVTPLREAVTRFYRTDSKFIDESNRLYLRDLVDHVAQILDGIDNQRDVLSNLEALYQAEAANRLNHVMRLLTVISTIFIPLSFIASVYGMNFDNMPELRSPHGYYIVLAVMFSATVGMLAYFRRKRWI